VLERDLARLSKSSFDVVVVGAGIYGAWTALDAARRGLRVALIEQADFGHATSANSQRIVHGGLRYLQHGDLRRFRESVRERSTLLRVAPHLVRPLPILVPTHGLGLRSRGVLGAALKVNDWLSAGRNRDVPQGQEILGGRLVSRDACLRAFEGFDGGRLTGGALFHDGQVPDSERLCLSVLRSAADEGAAIANYLRVTGFLRDGSRIVGVQAEDLLGGGRMRIGADLVVGCAGPWTAQLEEAGAVEARSSATRREFPVLRAVVLLTRPIVRDTAVAVAGDDRFHDDAELVSKGFRNFFVTPWRGRSMVGTYYTPFEGDPERLGVTPEEIDGFLAEFNAACSGIELRREDVSHVFAGLVPRQAGTADVFAKQFEIIDHEPADGVQGRITVVGVKWTTARRVAEQTVDLALTKLRRPETRCGTRTQPIHGGDLGCLAEYLDQQRPLKPVSLSNESFEHLIETYGTGYHEVLGWCRTEPELLEPVAAGRPEIQAEVVHGVRAEMARTLVDVIFRRTGLGTLGRPGSALLGRCAALMASEFGWDERERARQLGEVEAVYERVGVACGGDTT